MSDIDKLEQHCVAGGTSVGSSPGQSLGPTSTSQTRVPPYIATCSTAAHSQTFH